MDLEPRLNLTRKTAAACLLAALTLVAVPASAQKPDSKRTPPLPPLNQKVLDFARESLGKKVVNGECTDLAVEALRHAGARRFPRERSGDYIWGRPIDSFKDALPGDVLQFRDAVFQGGRVLGGNRKSSWRQDYPHHTAILAEVRERDGEIMVLHQNVGKSGSDEAAKRVVKKDAIRPGSLQEGGWVRIYRPVAPDDEPPSSEPRQR